MKWQNTLTFLSLLVSLGAEAAVTPSKEIAVDLAKAKDAVEFMASATPGGLTIRGEVPKDASPKAVTGNLVLKNEQLTGTVKVALDALDTGIGLRNKHMKDHLETTKFPEATLVLNEVDLKGKNGGDKVPFKGNLTLHGQSKPVEGTVVMAKQDKAIEFDFAWPVSLKDYGIDVPPFMGIHVADKVEIRSQVQTSLD